MFKRSQRGNSLKSAVSRPTDKEYVKAVSTEWGFTLPGCITTWNVCNSLSPRIFAHSFIPSRVHAHSFVYGRVSAIASWCRRAEYSPRNGFYPRHQHLCYLLQADVQIPILSNRNSPPYLHSIFVVYRTGSAHTRLLLHICYLSNRICQPLSTSPCSLSRTKGGVFGRPDFLIWLFLAAGASSEHPSWRNLFIFCKRGPIMYWWNITRINWKRQYLVVTETAFFLPIAKKKNWLE